jgi:hypothetical protein
VPASWKQEVVPLAAAGGVLPGVVDDVVGADGADHVQVPRAAHAGHLGAEPPGELDREGADPSGCADDQDLLAGPDPPVVTQALEGGQTGQGHGRRLLEAQVGRLGSHDGLRDTGVLGEGALEDVGEHLVTGPEPGHGPADGLDLPGHVAPEAAVPGDAQPERPHDIRQAAQEVPVPRVDRGRADPDQDLVVLDDGLGDLVELEDVR